MEIEHTQEVNSEHEEEAAPQQVEEATTVVEETEDEAKEPKKKSTKRIVGLLGKKGSGRRTIAGGLKAAGYVEFQIKKPLFDMAKNLFDLTDEEFSNPLWSGQACAYDDGTKKAGGISPDLIIRSLRNDLYTRFGTEVLVRNLKNRIEKTRSKRIVITDVSNEEDATFIREVMGGIMIEVVRPKEGDEEEEKADCCDYLIKNEGTIE